MRRPRRRRSRSPRASRCSARPLAVSVYSGGGVGKLDIAVTSFLHGTPPAVPGGVFLRDIRPGARAATHCLLPGGFKRCAPAEAAKGPPLRVSWEAVLRNLQRQSFGGLVPVVR